MDGTVRIRTVAWFATAVVLSVLATLLVTQAWSVGAAPGDSDSTFVPVAPCRLFDSRPSESPNSGEKTPIGPGESNVRTQQVTGNIGNCVGIPAGATAVSMNVTIVAPTAQSNLRLFPADTTTPTASNLNWLPGQSPTPNKVDVKLSPSGQIKLYNHNGNVDVLADVVGYYTNSTLQEINQRLSGAEMSIAALETGLGTLGYISVAADGSTISASDWISSNASASNGIRHLNFDRDVSECIATATLGNLTVGPTSTAHHITLGPFTDNPSKASVRMTNGLGTLTNSKFMVLVYCPA